MVVTISGGHGRKRIKGVIIMDKALQTMIDNMPEKTGKSLDEWKVILRERAFDRHAQGVSFLKTEYKVSHGFANTIVSLAKDEQSSPETLVDTQYKGKEDLRPVYDELISFVKSLGDDITIIPKKGSVSIIRKRQFILIKPATKTRIDLGFKLRDTPITERLESSGPFGAMCTHRVRLSAREEVDAELKNWIKEAYEKST